MHAELTRGDVILIANIDAGITLCKNSLKDLIACGMSYILSNTNIFLEEFSAKKINNLQMYRYNAFDMSQVIIVENEMKIWT